MGVYYLAFFSLSLLLQIGEPNVCSRDVHRDCSWVSGCPSNSWCDDILGFGPCYCSGGRLWIGNQCIFCQGFQTCVNDQCVWKSGACDQCPWYQACSNGSCIWVYPYCDTNSHCSGGEFCKRDDPSDAYGQCTKCPNNVDTFCSIMGLVHYEVIDVCYAACGAGNAPTCECLQSWSDSSFGGTCGNLQNGCPTTSCNGGERWCKVSAKACSTSGHGGLYARCGASTATGGCSESSHCRTESFCDFSSIDYEGGQYGVCTTCAQVNNDCYTSGLSDSGLSTAVSECLHTCHSCSSGDMTCADRHFCHLDRGVDATGFCDQCDLISNCIEVNDAVSREECERVCECQDHTDCSGNTFCDFFADGSITLGICHSCPSSRNDCQTISGLPLAKDECEMECFPCPGNSCDQDWFCNFDRGNAYGFCEDCEVINDCTTEGLLAFGEQDCRDICKKFPTNLPTDAPSTSYPSLLPTTEEPTHMPSISPSTSTPSRGPSSTPSKSPSIDCSLIFNEADCRILGCAWLAHLGLCEQECHRLENTDTVGASITGYPSIQESLQKCEANCLEESYCERFTWKQAESLCTLYHSYSDELTQVGVTTGICVITFEPTPLPTGPPTTDEPSLAPSTDQPSKIPSIQPSSDQPTTSPSIAPTSDRPSASPSPVPSTTKPSANPTARPTDTPTVNPSCEPTANPSVYPTAEPSVDPTYNPTSNPTVNPTFNPTFNPTHFPSYHPSTIPSLLPTTDSPSVSPSHIPTTTPTETGIIDADIEFQGNYENVIGNNKELFLSECDATLQDVDCREVKSGSIILTIRGEESAVNSQIRNIAQNGLTLPNFATFTVTDEFARNNAESEPSSDQFYEGSMLFILIAVGLIVVVCACCAFIAYTGCNEKDAEVIDLASVYSGENPGTDDDFILPDEGGTAKGHEGIEMMTPPGKGNITPGGGESWAVDDDGLSPFSELAKRTPGRGLSNHGSEGHHEGPDIESFVTKQVGKPEIKRMISSPAERDEIADGLFGKGPSNIEEGTDSRAGSASRNKQSVGGAPFKLDIPDIGEDDLLRRRSSENGLYAEGRRNSSNVTGRESNHSSVVGEGPHKTESVNKKQKLNIKSCKDDGFDTRISLSLDSENPDPGINLQDLYNERIRKQSEEPRVQSFSETKTTDSTDRASAMAVKLDLPEHDDLTSLDNIKLPDQTEMKRDKSLQL